MADRSRLNEVARREVAASPGSADLLGAAHTIVVEHLAELRSLATSAQQRSDQLKAELRHTERMLDEAATQRRFANDRNLAATSVLAQREKSLRATYDTLSQEAQSLQRTLKQLDQLVRQIDMSSAALSGAHEEEQADPWVLALRSQVIKGREEERVRLAREVHDSPAQILANVLMGLEQCCQLVESQRIDRLGVMLDRLRTATRDGLHEVRHFIADLRPGSLEEQGLAATIHDYIRRYCDSYNANATFEAESIPRFDLEAEIVLYRIVQEALQNAHKHARGAAVIVTLAIRSEQLVLTICDDGPGFNPREVVRRAGRESWGLTSMRERAELIGAHFVVTSGAGRGTEVAVSLPLSGADVNR